MNLTPLLYGIFSTNVFVSFPKEYLIILVFIIFFSTTTTIAYFSSSKGDNLYVNLSLNLNFTHFISVFLN